MALWTQQEQQMIRPINDNNYQRFEMLQQEVEINDLPKYLGFEFYQELMRNTANYATLLVGGTYTYEGYTYRFEGLKYVCAYLLYARYVRESSFNDTFSGIVRHSTQDVQPISFGELKNLEDRYKTIAGAAWDNCKKYLATLDIDFEPKKSKLTRKIDWL